MIKLNNKNITYVALADTNNSIKAPKEIWYADSNNSVKLVYRRKDALIEGEDYEKFHWLKTTEYAYINTKVKGNQDSNVEVIGIQYTNSTTYSLTLYGSVPSDVNRAISFNTSTISSGRNTRFGNRTLLLGDFNTNQEYDVVQNKDTLIVNGSTISNTQATNNFESDEIYVFASNITDDITPYLNRELSIRKFVISDVINLIPCKLLKPVPKWLDANGIRRQVGECGMIDLVSGKFYGNVNSVGTFTVENYYERKEWLVGDGSAYIDTNIIVDVPSLYINTKFTTTDSSYYEPLFGSRNQANYNGSHIWYLSEDNQIRVDVLSSDNSALHCNIQSSINSLILDVPNNIISINNVSESGKLSDYSIKNSVYTFHIFNMKLLGAVGSIDRRPYSGALSGFTLNDSTHSLDLIPCTLTMDLPASMDANNIARTKGTSGMWDLVSDRFYGNVANSGTFKAVNLAEGVDYEVHDWLVGSVNEGATLPANGADIELDTPIFLTNKVMTITMGSVCRDIVMYGSSVNGAKYIIPMYSYASGETHIQERYGNDNTIHSIVDNLSGTKTITIDFMNKVATVGNNSFNIDGVGYRFQRFGNLYWSATKTIGNITIDNELNLVPVKLLRSIPAKYDANGIARNAGECGMYDTVNDKFYGNVASSGTFSVSD